MCHMAPLFDELRARFITFCFFVHWQSFMARNVGELFSSNRGISHLYKACHTDELSRGPISGLEDCWVFGFGLL